MEYEYGHSDMPYKYMRQAIQYANPAPHGDYSKNLVTLNEAGEYAFEIPVFPSGMSEGSVLIDGIVDGRTNSRCRYSAGCGQQSGDCL